MKRIGILIPCFNEEENVALINAAFSTLITKYQEELHFDKIFINDGSTDQTMAEIKKLEEISDDVKYINLSRNFGKEATIVAGLDYVLKKQYDATVIIDADLQMPIKYVESMLLIWQTNQKLILTIKQNRRLSPAGILAKNYYKIFNHLSNVKINEEALDFVFMDISVVKELVRYQENIRYFKAMIADVGFDPVVIPVEIVEREKGKSKFSGFFGLIKYALMSIANYSKIPLYLGIYLGLFMATISFIYAIQIIFNYFINAEVVRGYSSIMSVILFFFGIVLIILGVIGYYIGIIFEEIKKRPKYIVKETSSDKEK